MASGSDEAYVAGLPFSWTKTMNNAGLGESMSHLQNSGGRGQKRCKYKPIYAQSLIMFDNFFCKERQKGGYELKVNDAFSNDLYSVLSIVSVISFVQLSGS